jgi:DNA repair ATPase RecN
MITITFTILTIAMLITLAASVNLYRSLQQAHQLIAEYRRGRALDAEALALRDQRIGHLETAIGSYHERVEWLVAENGDLEHTIHVLEKATARQALFYVMASVPTADRPFALGRKEKICLN